MKYNLPKSYLSYSAMQLWWSSKNSYRAKYYSTDPPEFSTVYTELGKEIAEILEDPKKVAEHPVLSTIPIIQDYEITEYQVEHEIEGVPIKGYLDGFDPYKFKILEHKTAIKKGAKAPWDALKVRKHEQILLYSLLIKEIHGYVDPVVTLCWMETEWAEHCEDTIFDGKKYRKCVPRLQLSGHYEIFEREIRDWEYLRMKALIKKTAEEISADYTRYQQAGLDT